MLVFSSGLMVLLHFRSSTGGFRCALPEKLSGELSGESEAWWGLPKVVGITQGGGDYPRAGLSQTQPVGKSLLENPWWITQSRFKANSTLGVSLLFVLLMPSGHLRAITGLSEAFQWGVGGVVPAHRCPAPGLGGCGWPDYSSAR